MPCWRGLGPGESELAEYCRKRRLYREQIRGWRRACEGGTAAVEREHGQALRGGQFGKAIDRVVGASPTAHSAHAARPRRAAPVWSRRAENAGGRLDPWDRIVDRDRKARRSVNEAAEAAGAPPLPSARTQKAANDGRIHLRSRPVKTSTHSIACTLSMQKIRGA